MLYVQITKGIYIALWKLISNESTSHQICTLKAFYSKHGTHSLDNINTHNLKASFKKTHMVHNTKS